MVRITWGDINMGRLKEYIRRIIYPNKYSSDKFVVYLRSIGVKIGDDTFFFDPVRTKIDTKRASYLKIGSKVKITTGVQFLCHDYSWSTIRPLYHEILPDPGKAIEVGDNVFIGWNTLIIGPVKIGSNVIIGANSVVTHDIPSNTVWAGNPAKQITTIEEYYHNRHEKQLENAAYRARHIKEVTGNMPSMDEMGWFGVLYLPRNRESEKYLRTLPFKGDSINEVITDFYSTKPEFESFDVFLRYVFEGGKIKYAAYKKNDSKNIFITMVLVFEKITCKNMVFGICG